MSGPPLAERAESLGVELGPVEAGRLERFEGMLAGRAARAGMISRADVSRLRERHILDCLRAAAVVAGAEDAYDLGSGAGLPGIVVAIAVPRLRVGLVESRRTRAAFLETVVRDLPVENAAAVHRRVEDLSEPVDLCFARAFAPLPRAWDAAQRLLRPGGRLAYFAGRELDRASLPVGAVIVPPPAESVLASAGVLVIMTRQ
ncbi:MAG TPA: RsmG family class I SAM-dependent methyltransferase [Actinomycetota bacterium]|jgi:16S rRNA (guanine527-N7)-methyltransferase